MMMEGEMKMSVNSDAADMAISEIVKVTIDGIDLALRITGFGAKKTGALLVAGGKWLIGGEKTAGKIRMKKMLQKGGVTCFTIRFQDLQKFQRAAKKSGLLYSVILQSKLVKDINKNEPNSPVVIAIPTGLASHVSKLLDLIEVNVLGKATVETAGEVEKSAENSSENTMDLTPEESSVIALYASEELEETASPEALRTGDGNDAQSEKNLNVSTANEDEDTKKHEEAKNSAENTIELTPEERSLMKTLSLEEEEAVFPEEMRTGEGNDVQPEKNLNVPTADKPEKNKAERYEFSIPQRSSVKRGYGYNQFNDFKQRTYSSKEEAELEKKLVLNNQHSQWELDLLEKRLKASGDPVAEAEVAKEIEEQKKQYLEGRTEKPSVRAELKSIESERKQAAALEEAARMNEKVSEALGKFSSPQKEGDLK